MRVLILHSRYLTGAASGENQVVDDEAKLLRDAGHEVVVWTPSAERVQGMGLLSTGARAVWSRSASKEVKRLIERHRIDVVHCHNLFSQLSPAVLRTAADAGAAVLVTLHNFRMMCLPATFLRDGKVCELCLGKIPWRGVRYGCYRDSRAASLPLASSLTLHRGLGSYDRVDRYLAVSDFVRSKHVEAGIDPDRIKVKPNFSWPIERSTTRGDHFLYIGRLTEEKGLLHLLEAWTSIGAQLLIVGTGPLEDELRRIAPPHVRVEGAVEPAEARRMIAEARALVVPSVWYEGAPRTLVEAYAAGIPLVASRIGGLAELVIEDVSGYLVDLGWQEGWVQAIDKLMDDGVAQRLGEGAHRLWVENYSPERALKNLESSYEDALRTRST